MRFKVFGGADCTDMFLAQMVPVVPLSVAELQDLASKAVALTVANNNAAAQQAIMDQLIASYQSSSSGGVSSGGVVAGSGSSINSSNSSTTNLGLACCALHTLITNIVVFDVDSEQAAKELHILGLEPAAAKALVETATAHRAQILAATAEAVRMAPTAARVHVQARPRVDREVVVVTAANRRHKHRAAADADGPPELGGGGDSSSSNNNDNGVGNAKDNGDDSETTFVVTLDKRSDSSATSSSRNVLSFTADAATLKSLLSELIVAREAM